MATERRIVLKAPDTYDLGRGEADGAILPGEMIELAADGKYDRLASSKAEALKGAAGLKIAVEDALQGRTVDDAYADGDQVFFYEPKNGDHLLVLVASGENIAVGDTLVPTGGGDGKFEEAGGSETRYAFEALESTGGALAADTLVKVRCLW